MSEARARPQWSDWLFFLAWNVVAAAALMIGLTLYTIDRLPWNSPRYELVQILAAVGGYLLVAATLVVLVWQGRRAFLWSALVSALAFGLVSMSLLIIRRPHSAEVIELGLLVSAVLAPLAFIRSRLRLILLVALILTTAGLTARGVRPQFIRAAATTRVFASELADLDIVTYRGRFPGIRGWGGAIASFRNRFLVVDAKGRFTDAVFGADDSLTTTPLLLRAPLNAEDFDREALPEAARGIFRVADLLVRDLGDHVSIVVSHHFWQTGRNCWVVRVSRADVPTQSLTSDPGHWTTLFESKPCLPMRRGLTSQPFVAQQSGGAMAWVDETHLILTLGDHGFDGVNDSPGVSQDPDADYGKVLLLDVASGKTERLASGLRNSQGLFIDGSGTIWFTDQGPQGGDELNQLERGADYGWPAVTLGTQYGGSPWPLSRVPGDHTGFRLPLYSWVPSIAPSSVIVVQKNWIAPWQGDLLVTSLAGQTLYRIRVRENRVIYAEPIQLGFRLRDLTEGSDGRIVIFSDAGVRISSDAGVLISLRPSQQQNNGERLFGQCAGCHAIGDGRTHGLGPDLAGIALRQVAVVPGFEFSAALRRAGGKWSDDRLSEFLRDPQAFAPGTTMQFGGISKAEERAALIAFMQRR